MYIISKWAGDFYDGSERGQERLEKYIYRMQHAFQLPVGTKDNFLLSFENGKRKDSSLPHNDAVLNYILIVGKAFVSKQRINPPTSFIPSFVLFDIEM